MDAVNHTWPGGRKAGLDRLRHYDPAGYGRRRNFLDAPVSLLSPYLRHGMLSICEVRDWFKSHFAPELIEELLRQLAWRDFFEKVLAWHGDRLNHDLEPAKHQVSRSQDLPGDIAEAGTGLPCIDGMAKSLFETGYLHNHERLWFAAYVCHFRGVRWQVGAKLFREFLLDGDWASNSCSWQWVESTFASKPYFMNKDNIATFSNHRWCEGCHVKCPFDAPYERLEQSLFSSRQAPLADSGRQPPSSRLTLPIVKDDDSSIPAEVRSIVWVHDAAMSAVDRAILANTDAMLVFIFDSHEPWAEHRYRFIREGWADLIASVTNRHHALVVGDPAAELERLALSTGCREIHVSEHPNPVVRRAIRKLESHCQVIIHPRAIFAEYAGEPKRFSRYWDTVASQVLGYRPRSGKRMK